MASESEVNGFYPDTLMIGDMVYVDYRDADGSTFHVRLQVTRIEHEGGDRGGGRRTLILASDRHGERWLRAEDIALAVPGDGTILG
jgi:hypothetical protein